MDRPIPLQDAARIIATWPDAAPSPPGDPAAGAALLDALAPLLGGPAPALRSAVLAGDPHAHGAMAALAAVVPAVIQAMVALLRQLAGQGDSQATLDRIPLLEALAAAAGDASSLAEAEYLRGYTFRRLGQTTLAIAAYQRALAHGGDAAFRSRTLDRLGNLQSDTGAFDEAASSYAAALAVETEPDGKAAILRNMANAMRDLGDYAAADAVARKAAALREGAAKDGYDLDAAAQQFSALGDHPWALTLSDRAQAWFTQNNPAALPVNAEIRIGLLYRAGRAAEAAAQFRLALDQSTAQARAMIRPEHYATGWQRSQPTRVPFAGPVTMAYAQASATGNAALLEQVIARAQQDGDNFLVLRARALRGGFLFDAGQYPPAVDELEDVQAQASAQGLALPEISALVTLAAISQDGGPVKRRPLGLLSRAGVLRDMLAGFLGTQKLSPLAFQIELNDNGTIDHQIAQAAMEMESWEEAAGFYELAAQRAEALNDRFKLANRLAGLRLAASRAGQAARAGAVADRLRALLASKDLPARAIVVAARALNAQDRATDQAAARRWIEQAAQAAEAVRAATPPAAQDGVGRQWNDVYLTLAQARREDGDAAGAFAAVQLGKARGFAASLAARAGLASSPPSLAALQSCLRADEAVLDIAMERTGLALYLVRPDSIQPVSIPGALDALLQPDAGDMRDRAASLLALAQGNAMLADVAARTEALLPQGCRLFIAPGPGLGNLPFHAIPAGGQAWCTRRRIGMLPTAAALLAPRRARTGRVLVMGDSRGDLPGARAECLAVAALYGTQPLIGQDCTAAALRDALSAGPIDLVHIAAHGRANPRRGGMASLLLADPSCPPRWTDLTGITKAAWDVGLVVLSGCSTGLAGRQDGTQSVSVASIVLRAGARAAVACLWPVGDAAAQPAMLEFHRRFTTGPDTGAALDEARAVLRAPGAATGTVRDGRGAPPTFPAPLEQALNWSAFMALGLPDPFT